MGLCEVVDCNSLFKTDLKETNSANTDPLNRPLILDGFRHIRTLKADGPQTGRNRNKNENFEKKKRKEIEKETGTGIT